MKSSLAHHILLDRQSAAIYIGTTVGELYVLCNNHAPEYLALYELNKIEISQFKKHDPTWFQRPLADFLPVLLHDSKQLFDKLWSVLCLEFDNLIPDYEYLHQEFVRLLPLKDVSLGHMIEILRQFSDKFVDIVPNLQLFFKQLSGLNFFELKGGVV